MSFTITQNDLLKLIHLYLERNGEQNRVVQQNGGSKYFLHGLVSHLKKGIRKGSIETRIQRYGRNEQVEIEGVSIWRLLLESFKDWITLLFMAICITTLIIDMTVTTTSRHKTSWIQSMSILIVITFSSIITAINDYYKETQFNKLLLIQQKRRSAAVIRQNQTVQVLQENIVVGDIIVVTQGMIMPVDAWVLQADGMQVDQSHIFQQYKSILKKPIQNILQTGQKESTSSMLLSGTKILAGQGKAIVMIVGKKRSKYSSTLQNLNSNKQKQATLLQIKLQKLTHNISIFGIISAGILLIAYIIRFIIYKIQEKGWSMSDLPIIFRFLLLCATVIMVSVPEGLPLSVSLSLGHSLKKMLQDKNLLRNLDAYEKIGQVSVICVGKSGLITSNKMDVTFWWNSQLFNVGEDIQMPIRMSLDNKYKQLLLINIFVNSSADIKPKDYGSPTQTGLIRFGQRFNETYGDYRMNYVVLQRLTFNSIRKRTSIVVQYEGQNYLFTKGAGQIILDQCTHYYPYNQTDIKYITKQDRKMLQNQLKQLALRGLRVVVLAHKQIGKNGMIDGECENMIYKIQSNNLVLTALIGLYDKTNEDVKQYVKSCRSAGIDVKMITGENLTSAISTAKQVGIIEPNRPSLCLEGQEFQIMIGGLICQNCRTQKCECIESERKNVIKNIEDFDRIVRRLDVLARVRPQDRLALVSGLKNKGIVVATTGRRKSDAETMVVADVSFAAGISGTHLAQEASSVILIDDHFNSILKSVLWGRNMYDSLRKFIQFQLTVNFVAVLFTLVGIIFIDQQPLSPIQLIWVNIIMDTLASLALSTEQPNPILLQRLPNNSNQSIINKRMWKHIIIQSSFQLFVLIALLFFGQHFIPQFSDELDSLIGSQLNLKYHNGNRKTVVSGRLYRILSTDPDYLIAYQKLGMVSRHFTFIFNTFVFLQLFNFINSRKLYDQINVFNGLTKNLLFCIVVGGAAIVQVLIVTFGSVAFELYSYYGLKPMQWVMSIGIGCASLVLSLIIKMMPESQEDDTTNNLRKKRVNKSGNLALRLKETQQQSDCDIV